MELKDKKCIPCEGGIPPLTPAEIQSYLARLGQGWTITSAGHLWKSYHFVNFRHTMSAVNTIADIAESEGHHPDLYVSYGKLEVEIWTHSIQNLSENDFILASKIDKGL